VFVYIFPERELCCCHGLLRPACISGLLREMIPVGGVYARAFCMYQTKFRRRITTVLHLISSGLTDESDYWNPTKSNDIVFILVKLKCSLC
jgi:hypothetical protein